MFPGRFFSIRVTIIIVLVLFVSFGCKEPDSVIETAEYRISANGDSAILKSVTTTLSEYTVPESVLIDGIEYPVEEIGASAFSGQTSIERLYLPSSLKKIGGNAFYGCSSLRNAEIRADINEIPVSLFAGCTVLESVTIPKTVKKIGDEAFSGCSSLETVTLPTSLEIIGDSAFYKMTSMTEIKLPSGLLEIGEGAFQGSGLIELTIPESVESVGSSYRWLSES